MAVSSFPRPDPTSPASVASAEFGTSRRGFDQKEVRDFLRLVGAELSRLHEREQTLERALLEAKDARGATGEVIDDSTATRLLGEEAAHILQAARESAAMVKGKAEEGASTILSEATEEAARLREEADLEAARRRSEAAAEAESELAVAKQQGREMVNEARSYRERVLGELTRRRDLARSQIDQLLQGREQLLSAFTSARDAAMSVMAELGPIGDAATPFELPPSMDLDDEDDAPAVDEPDLDEASGDDVTAAAPSAEADGPAEPGESGDTAERVSAFFDQDHEDDERDGPRTPGRVVELFPHGADDDSGGAADQDANGSDEPAGDDADDGSTTTVESLFAKLRAASVDEDVVGDTTELPTTDLLGAGADPADDDADAATDVDAVDETPFERRDADLTPLIVAAARRVKRVLADEQNELLDTLRQGEPVRSVDALLAADTEQASRYVDAITTELEGAATAGAASISGDAGIDVSRSGALGPVRDLLGSNLVQPLRERLERAVADADGDNDAIAKRVRSVYREWKTRQVDDQLDDVFRMAYGRGVLAALPEGTPTRWIVDPAGPDCPDAEDNSLSEPIPAGESFPTGHVCAPAHAGCRCLLEPAER